MLKKFYKFFPFVLVFSFVFISTSSALTVPAEWYSYSVSGTAFSAKACDRSDGAYSGSKNCIADIVTNSALDKVDVSYSDPDSGQTLKLYKDNAGLSTNLLVTSSSNTCTPTTPCVYNDTPSWTVSTGLKTRKYIVNDGTIDSTTATYNITLSYAPITIEGKVDGASFTWGGTLAQGKTLKTTCTNSTNMKVGLDGGPYSSVGTKNGYTITYDFPNNNTGTTALTYKIICQNIGGTANEQARTFNLAPTIPSPSGNINATGCTILSGASTCNGSINWTTTNPTHTSQVTSNYPAANTTVATGNSNSGMSVSIPYSSRTFFLYHNGAKLGEATATATCASGTNWNSYLSQCVPAPTGSLTGSSCTIAAGSSSCSGTVNWSVSNPTGNSSVTSNYPSANTTVGTGVSGSQSVTIPYSSRTFYLYTGGTQLKSLTLNASCASGTSWNSYLSQCASASVTSLTAANCTITEGANSCSTTVNWSVSNPTGNSSVTSNYPSANTTIATGHTGSQSVTIPYSSRTFYLYNNSVEKASVTPTATCTAGTIWNGSSCACPAGYLWNSETKSCGLMSGSIPQKACTIAIGSGSCNITLTWSTTNPIGTSQVTSNTPTSGTVIGNGNSGSVSVSVPYSSRNFYLYNDGQLLDEMKATATCVTGSTYNSTTGKCVAPAGTLTGTNCSIAIGGNSCNTTINWNVTGAIGNTAVTSNYPSANTTVGSGHSGSQSVAIPYSSRSFWLYNNSTEQAALTVNATCATGSSWSSSFGKCTPSCSYNQILDASGTNCVCPPSAPNKDINGFCYADCYYGYDWNPEAKECLPKCPTGQLFVNNTCMDINRQPICTWLNPFVNNFSKVTCDITFYPCGENKETVFNVLYKDGAANKTLPNITTFEGPRNFNWAENQREYRYVCPNGDFWYADALKRPYTHFMSFDVSVGQVKKGSTINLSWQVQLPNTTCKIVGTSLKDGTVKFDSANYSKIKNNITDPSLATLNYSNVGNFHTLISSYLQVDESMRFVASCTDTSYNKGYSQLVRDVYVVDEADR
ncbi:MAG TPA: hypothetical protein PLE26_02035 [Candidatus Paceibacterota bacterium]|nr:hypothetical protein [Candidatus Paceibacterota bacterium]HQB57230.1 hypothetical protein [Candidatus Paceibacterota bacterium]